MATARPLERKISIVTGASRGIGAAICENLAAKGCSLLMVYTSNSSVSKTENLASELAKKHGIDAFPVKADLGSNTGGQEVVDAARKHFGSRGGDFVIDIVINNAGVSGNHYLKDYKTEDLVEDFQFQYRINVLGPLLLIHAVQDYLPTDGSGRIVNVSSISSSQGPPSQSIYGGTKAALESMTRTWARELGFRATVNAVNPGPVATEMWGSVTEDFLEFMRGPQSMTPRAQVRKGHDDEKVIQEVEERNMKGRAAQPSEIAGVVGMLCSAESGWCTGSVINANGGQVMLR